MMQIWSDNVVDGLKCIQCVGTRVRTFCYNLLSVKCYQCAYSPGKTTYKEIHEPVSVRNPYNPHEKKVEYRVKKVG